MDPVVFDHLVFPVKEMFWRMRLFFKRGNWPNICHQEDVICKVSEGEYFTYWDRVKYQRPTAYFNWNTCPKYIKQFCQTDKASKLARKAVL